MFVDRDELQPYIDGRFDLIPIHRWDRKIDGRERGKSPRDARWIQREYTWEEIDNWIDGGGNVGVRLGSDDLVIDIDPKSEDAKGATAADLETLLELELGISLASAPAVETGSGGRHIYLKRDPDTALRGKLDAFGRAIEFKQRGTQVLAAGSKHPSGNIYRWLRRGDPAPAPTELIAALCRPETLTAPPTVALGSAQLARCLEQLKPEDFRGYEEWRNLMFAVHDACHGTDEGREAFVKWSTSDPPYKDEEESIRALWDAIRDDREGGRTARTLFWHLNGKVPPPPADEDFEDLPPEEQEGYQPAFRRDSRGQIKAGLNHNIREAILTLGLDFKRNLFTDQLEFFTEGRWRSIDDDVFAHISRLINDKWGKRWSGDPDLRKIHQAIKWITETETRHPVREYLERLEWDGRPRIETWLIKAAGAKSTPYVRAASRLLLVAAVARIFEPGIKFDAMIILEGRQGAGKSRLVRALGGRWTLEGLPPLRSPNDKDVISAMLGYWLIEIEELAAMRKADAETLKAFVSKTEDRVRLPYEATSRTFPRQCVLIGTTNDNSYLRDITGNRRFIPIAINTVDFSRINRDQLWAEALVEFRKEEVNEIVLPQSVWDEAEAEQEARRAEDPWEELISEYIAKVGSDEPLSSELLFTEVFHKPFKDASMYDVRRLAQIMQRLGWFKAQIRINGVKRRGFRLKNIDRMFD